MYEAKISESQLVNHEFEAVLDLVDITFDEIEESWTKARRPSPYRQWYKDVATGQHAVSNETPTEDGVFEGTRLISWKQGKPFDPEYLFFRTVDTGRLLPMDSADFRAQFWAYRGFWDKIDTIHRDDGGRKWWICQVLPAFLHQILVIRNMHDTRDCDIPVILTTWDDAQFKSSLNYWVELSKGEWTEEERRLKFLERNNPCHRILPCFEQVDILVRALLTDPEVGDVPPFIIFHSVITDGNTCVLFTKPSHFPPPSLTRNLPASCNCVGCTRTDCSRIDFSLSRSLAEGSAMVRKTEASCPGRILCNLEDCEVEHLQDGNKLQRCQRCKEALYCSSEHQRLDWETHKNVCEKRF
ncbi:hypothetical protein R3P38DRAFT_2826210 [Favolaschia claudopus]|uniref:MYND-type domain-containing protein n=1 Tax=Favolaschia claudopus TaxID=2862362 RepID=A0AAW0EH08_9AGAR